MHSMQVLTAVHAPRHMTRIGACMCVYVWGGVGGADVKIKNY